MRAGRRLPPPGTGALGTVTSRRSVLPPTRAKGMLRRIRTPRRRPMMNGKTTWRRGNRGASGPGSRSARAPRIDTMVRLVVQAMLAIRRRATPMSTSPTTPTGSSRAPPATSQAVTSVPSTRWCHTSSMVSHEEKKLHRNTRGGPFRGRERVEGVHHAEEPEDEKSPTHGTSVPPHKEVKSTPAPNVTSHGATLGPRRVLPLLRDPEHAHARGHDGHLRSVDDARGV